MIDLKKKKIASIEKKEIGKVKPVDISGITNATKKTSIGQITKNLEDLTGKKRKPFKIDI